MIHNIRSGTLMEESKELTKSERVKYAESSLTSYVVNTNVFYRGIKKDKIHISKLGAETKLSVVVDSRRYKQDTAYLDGSQKSRLEANSFMAQHLNSSNI